MLLVHISTYDKLVMFMNPVRDHDCGIIISVVINYGHASVSYL